MLSVELLDATHARSGFDCGVEPLNRYLQQIARQHITKGISKTFVLVDEAAAAPKPVLGFFSISPCQVLGQHVPAKWAKKLPRQIPALRLGRLAVARTQQGAGYGKALLVEAILRVARVADLAGGIGLFVDAKDDAAAGFYARFGFEPTPSDPLTLFMPAATIRQLAPSTRRRFDALRSASSSQSAFRPCREHARHGLLRLLLHDAPRLSRAQRGGRDPCGSGRRA